MWSPWNAERSDYWVIKFTQGEEKASDMEKGKKEKKLDGNKYVSHPKEGKIRVLQWNGFLWKAGYSWTFPSAC